MSARVSRAWFPSVRRLPFPILGARHAGWQNRSFVTDRAAQLSKCEAARIVDVGTAYIGFAQHGVSQIGLGKLCPAQHCLREVSALDSCGTQVGAAQLSGLQSRKAEIGSAKACFREINGVPVRRGLLFVAKVKCRSSSLAATDVGFSRRQRFPAGLLRDADALRPNLLNQPGIGLGSRPPRLRI